MVTERRRFTRLDLNHEASLQTGESRHKVAAIRNLSVGGCRLALPGPFPPGQECSVVIRLHHMAPDLEITGTILRSTGDETTVRFTAISPENLHHLHNLVRYNADRADCIEDEFTDHPGLL